MSEHPRGKQVQVITTSFLALFSVVGVALYGLPFFYDFLVRDLGWTREQVTSGNALSKLVVGPLFGFLAGWIIDRLGPPRVMTAGIIMAGFALLGLSRVTTLPFFYFFYFFNALGYVCGGPLPNQVLLSRWFDKARGKAMGVAYLGIGLGGTIVPLASHWLAGKLGWRTALSTLGILIIAIALPMTLFVKSSPPARHRPEQAREVSVPPAAPIRASLSSASFYLLAVASMCSIGAIGGTNQNLKLYLSLDSGYSQANVARILALVLASSLIGRLLMGWMADKYPKKYVMLLIQILIASSVPLLFLARTPQALYLFAALFGIGLGGDYMIIPLMAAELFGTQILGRLMGILITADGAAEALVPMLVAKTRDTLGSYSIGFMIITGLAAAGAVGTALLPRRKPARADDEYRLTPVDSLSDP